MNINGNSGDEILDGTPDADTINGQGGNDTLNGLAGNDAVRGGDGNDSLSGGEGDDTLFPGLGTNILDGGIGLDRAFFSNLAGVSLDLRLIGPQVQVDGSSYHFIQVAGMPLSSVENLSGTAFNDAFTGDAGDNRLAGNAGNDTLSGGDGDDLLLTGQGLDVVDGGAGLDTLSLSGLGSAGTISLLVDAPQAFDGGSVDIVFVDGISTVENIDGTALAETLGGDARGNRLAGFEGDDVLFGGDGDDNLTGGAGQDILYGGDGNDALTGDAGDDTFQINNVGDRVFEAADGGFDRAFVTVNNWIAGANLEGVYLVGAATTLFGGNADDTLVASATLGSQVGGGQGNDTLWGQDFGDVLQGAIGNDVLRGGGGNDTLSGGLQNDQLVGGAGADVFVFDETGWGYDQIFEFSRAEGDRIDMRGSGIASLADFAAVQAYPGATQLVAADGSIIDVYGLAGLVESDFIFA